VQVHRLSDGAYIRTIGSKGSGNGQFAGGYGGVAFDSEGNLVVADYGNHRVQVLRYSDGAHVRTIGSQGAGAGQFQYPTGVAFDAAGHIVVVEEATIACKCCATATAPMFAPSAAKAQATGNSTCLVAASPSTATAHRRG
jgi:hypothetical protein